MERRAAREDAIGKLNAVAVKVGVDPILKRSGADDVTGLYKTLCKKVSSDMVDELVEARQQYVDNGSLDGTLIVIIQCREKQCDHFFAMCFGTASQTQPLPPPCSNGPILSTT